LDVSKATKKSKNCDHKSTKREEIKISFSFNKKIQWIIKSANERFSAKKFDYPLNFFSLNEKYILISYLFLERLTNVHVNGQER
jgi:hypothetical protein